MGVYNDFLRLDIKDEHGRMHVPDPKLVDLAVDILRQYIEMRPNFVKGKVSVSKRMYKHFYRAAELCKQLEMSPRAFTRVQLEGMARTGKFWPSAIASKRHVEIASTSNRALSLRFIRLYRSMLTLYERHVQEYGCYETLRDPTLQFTPLFRVALATRMGFDDIISDYKDEARAELDSIPVARDAFKGMLGAVDGRTCI